MSKSIDERVVSMSFDNKHFEKNASQSMSTIDKLNDKLRMRGASEGIKRLEKELGKFSLTDLSKAADQVNSRFSALGVAGLFAIQNITNSAIHAGKQITKAFTVDPIKMGFNEYETQINAVQTILANTSRQGTKLEDVKAALDELNHYADRTIYDFTEMTRNIGTFTAAGVNLKTSVSAIKGIANLAAISGSTSQQASVAMYQLSQALAAGTVKLQDWNSVVNAGMGGQVFQDALKETARVHGIAIDQMIKQEGSFRETLSKGWLTSEILTETLSKFTGDLTREQLEAMGYTEKQIKGILAMGKTANDAATKVKTFTQLFDTLKEAAQSGWTQSWETVIGDFEEARTLLTDLSDGLSEVINAQAEARNEMLADWKTAGGRDTFWQGMINLVAAFRQLIVPIKNAFTYLVPPMTSQRLLEITKNFEEFTRKLYISDEAAHKVERTVKGLLVPVGLARDFIVAGIKGLSNLLGYLVPTGKTILDITADIGDAVVAFREWTQQNKIFERGFEAVSDALGFFTTVLTELAKSGVQKLSETIKGFSNWIDQIRNLPNIQESLKAFASRFKIEFNGMNRILSAASEFIQTFRKNIKGLNKTKLTTITNSFKKFKMEVKNYFSSFGDGFSGVKNALKHFTNELDFAFDEISEKVGSFKKDVDKKFESIRKTLNSFFRTAFTVGASTGIILFLKKVAEGFANFSSILDSAGKALLKVGNAFSKSIKSINRVIKAYAREMNAKALNEVAEGILKIVAAVAILTMLDQDKTYDAIEMLALLSVGLMGMVEVAGKLKAVNKLSLGVTGLATAILAMVGALKLTESLDKEGIIGRIAVMVSLLTALGVFAIALGKFAPTLPKASLLFVSIGASLVILVQALKMAESLDPTSIETSMTALLLALGAMAGVMLAASKLGKGSAISVLATAVSIKLIVGVLQELADFNIDESNLSLDSLIVVFGTLGVLLLVARSAGRGAKASGVSILAIALAMNAVVSLIKRLNEIEGKDIAKGIITVGLLSGLFSALIAVTKFAGPNSLKVGGFVVSITGAMLGLAAVVVMFGAMDPDKLKRATLAITILGAMFAAIIGISHFAVGAEKTIITVIGSVTALGALVAAMSLLDPGKLQNATECMVMMMSTLGVLILVSGLAKTVSPSILIVIGVVAGLGAIIAALTLIDVDKAHEVTESLSISLLALSAAMAILTRIPSAGIAVAAKSLLVGIGVIGAIIAAVGALSLIPGFDDFVSGAGKGLEAIGTAIGRFIGGFGGGVALGATAALPAIALNIKAFAENLKPFFDMVSGLDESSTKGIKNLVDAVWTLTKTDFVSGFTGGANLSNFGTQLTAFGDALHTYYISVKDLDDDAISKIEASASAAKALSEVAKNLPRSGGFAELFSGNNDFDQFGRQLSSFGSSMKTYYNSISDLDEDAYERINISANAVSALSQVAKEIPNTEGLWGWLSGKGDFQSFGTQLSSFGGSLVEYYNVVKDLPSDAKTVVLQTTSMVRMLANAADLIPSDGLFGQNGIDNFGSDLTIFANQLKTFYDSAKKVPEDALETVTGLVGIVRILSENMPATTSVGFKKGGYASFGRDLVSFGQSFITFAADINGVSVTELSTAVEKIRSLSGELAGYLEEFKMEFSSLGKSFGEDFVQAVKGLEWEYKEAGLFVGRGLVKGLKDSRGSVRQAATELARSIDQAIRDELEIHSPSGKAIYDAAMVAKGYIVGTKESLPEVVSTVKDAGKETYGSFFEAITGKTSQDSGQPSQFEELGEEVSEDFAEGIEHNKAPERAATQKAKAVVKAFSEEIAKWDLDATTAGLEYQLWEALNPNATEAQKTQQNLALTAEKIQYQAQVVALAQKEYQDAVQKYGQTAEKTQETYNKYLQEQIEFAQLSNTLTESQNTLQQEQNNSYQRYVQALSEWTQYADDLQSIGYTMEDIQKAAAQQAGYNLDAPTDIGKITDTVSNTMGTIKDVYSAQSNAVLGEFTNDFTNWGNSYASALGQGIQNGSNEVKQSTQLCLNEIKSTQPNWIEAGKSLIDGLIQGMRSKREEAINESSQIAQSLYQAMSAGLKLIGQETSEFDSLREGLVEMSDIINSGIDLNPTITPVVDMSDVDKKLGSLSKETKVSGGILGGVKRIVTTSKIVAEAGTTSVPSPTSKPSPSPSYTFTQNNYSPKSLSRLEIYRQTNNQFAAFKEVVKDK